MLHGCRRLTAAGAILAMLTVGQPHPACALNASDLEQLDEKFGELYRKGDLGQAFAVAKQMLTMVESVYGPDHPSVALALTKLARFYQEHGLYTQAEPLLKRALAIREKTQGPDHIGVGDSLNNLAELYRTQRQFAQAEPLYKRSLAIAEKALGPDHPGVAVVLNNLGLLYLSQGQYAQAEVFLKRSLAIEEKALGQDHPRVAQGLNNLAMLYQDQRQYAEAEPLFKRSLAIEENALGPHHPVVALSLTRLAKFYQERGRYAEAELLFKRALEIREQALGPDHPSVAQGQNYLAGIYHDQGQYAEAEPLLKRALAIREKALGPNHPDVAASLNDLAALYQAQGRYVQAEPLLKRALVIVEKALGPDHRRAGDVLNNLAELYRAQGRHAQAEPLYKRSLVIVEKELGPGHPRLVKHLNNLAMLYQAQGRHAEAEPLLKRALVIGEKTLRPDHPDVALSLNNLAGLYQAQGQYAEAEPLFKRVLAIREKALGPDHPDVAQSLHNLSMLHQAQGQYAEGLALTRRVTGIYRKRIVAGGTTDAAIREAASNKGGFNAHLRFLAINPEHEDSAKISDEALQVVQLAQASDTAAVVAKMAARFASGSDELAALVKRRQDAAERVVKQEAQLVVAASKPPQQRSADMEQKLRDDIAAAGKELTAIDVELAKHFPQYQELTHPEPVTLAKVQSLLNPGEAMLVYDVDKSSSFAWVITRNGGSFASIKVDWKALEAKVKAARAAMEVDEHGHLQLVNVTDLHDIYQQVFAPVAPYLAGINHLLVITSGPLQSLPLGMLVASAPPDIHTTADYRKVDWLARQYAISVLPSVSSIQAFRQFAKPGKAQEPFIGFGDPLIGAERSGARGRRAKIDIAQVFRGVSEVTGTNTPVVMPQEREIADVDFIRSVASLPETADELRTMAKVLKADRGAVWLQERATETNLKHLELTKYRTIAFSTHGVMAGELKGIGEPGLILTPPKVGTVEDDGYLSAGEIAQLKLNADWVILSACNTAAADGSPGAGGFSGLAKAFFYAGARSLLVSHWPVDSEATVPLTTGMLKEYELHPEQGKAEAHRKAMLTLMNTPDHPEFAHPLFWAPFVVVGEGGSGH